MNKEQAFLVLVLAVTAFMSLLVVLPFIEFVLLAVIVAYVLYPVNVRLERLIGRRLAPLVTIAVAAVFLLVPLGYVILILYRDLQRLAAGENALEVGTIEAWAQQWLGEDIDLAGIAELVGTNLLELLFGDFTQFLAAGVFVIIGLALVLFLVYYVLRDGAAFVEWIIQVVPAHPGVSARLLDQIDRTTRGVIVGHLFVALAQGLVGGIGFWVAGVPNAIFWTFVMILLSLLPLIGAFLVWAPAAGYLVLVGHPGPALFLLLWGLFVVSLIDNYARPIVIDREAHLNPAIILIGVFGGIYAIGFTGLFVGPIILGVFAAALRVFDEEWERIGEVTGQG